MGLLTPQDIADLAAVAQAAQTSNAAVTAAMQGAAPTDVVTRQRAGSPDLTGISVILTWPANPMQPDAPYGQKVECTLTASDGTDITYGDTIVRTQAVNFTTPLTGKTVYKVIGFEERGGAGQIVCQLAG